MGMQAVIFVFTGFVVKPLLLLALVGILLLCLRQRSAALQHFVLALGSVGILFLPLLHSGLPIVDWHKIPILTYVAATLDAQLLRLLASVQISQSVWLVILSVYLFGATTLFYYRLLDYVSLAHLSRKAAITTDTELADLSKQLCEMFDISCAVQIKTARAVNSPHMWGWRKPIILLPRDAVLWTEEKKLVVLVHELGHVSRRDWLVSQWVYFSCVIFWFLPPVWWMANTIYDKAEIACDDLIFRLNNQHLLYAQNLLSFADQRTSAAPEAGLNILGRSALYERIQAVLDIQRPRQPVAVEAAQYWFLIGLLVLVLIASVQIVPARLQANDTTQWSSSTLRWQDEPFDEITQTTDVKMPKPVLRKTITPTPMAIEEVHIQGRAIAQDPVEATVDLPKLKPLTPQIKIEGYLPLTLVTPIYPARALAKGIEAHVIVEFTIGADGSVSDAKVVSRNHSRVFDQAVLTAIKKSRYLPRRFDGQPVVTQGATEEFIFQLVDTDSGRRRP